MWANANAMPPGQMEYVRVCFNTFDAHLPAGKHFLKTNLGQCNATNVGRRSMWGKNLNIFDVHLPVMPGPIQC